MAAHSQLQPALLLLNPEQDSWVREIPKIDLDSYSANYSGRVLVERLYYIGTHSEVLCIDALKNAAIEAKKGKNVKLWLQCQQALQLVAPDDVEAQDDSAWCDRTMKQNAVTTERLEGELKNYKMNLIKESIRIANEELGQHYFEMGNLAQAADAFTRMRQEITVMKHTSDVGKHLISVNIAAKMWAAVASNTQKLLHIKALAPEEQKALQPWQHVPMGIANLVQGRHYDAALDFIRTEFVVGTEMAHICSANDIAIYGGLCALATMDRKDLQAKLLDSVTFRSYLELEPLVRRAIAAFVGGRYAVCLKLLEELRPDYLLDMYLAPQVSRLYERIRTKSIIQYCVPFSVVTLDNLAEAFGSTGDGAIGSMESELIHMINSKALSARIDTQNKILVHVPQDSRRELQSSTIEASKAYEKALRQKLQRMNIIYAGLECPKADRSARQEGFPQNEQMFPSDISNEQEWQE